MQILIRAENQNFYSAGNYEKLVFFHILVKAAEAAAYFHRCHIFIKNLI